MTGSVMIEGGRGFLCHEVEREAIVFSVLTERCGLSRWRLAMV